VSARVITDRDVATGQAGHPIVLDGNTLITPSARDRAVLLGILIVERGAALPAASAQSARSSVCARCGRADCGGCANGAHTGAVPEGLADGLYLVRIEGGRATSVLPASGPGRMVRRADRQDG